MKSTRSAILGLALCGWLAGCSETDTVVSVSVRYWTDNMDPSTFKVSIAKEGATSINSDIIPRQREDGSFDVLCQDNWRDTFCRFYKRFDVADWKKGSGVITLTGENVSIMVPRQDFEGNGIMQPSVDEEGNPITEMIDGMEVPVEEPVMIERPAGPFEPIEQEFDLVENAINVVYFELADNGVPGGIPDEPPPETDGGAGDMGAAGAGADDTGAAGAAAADDMGGAGAAADDDMGGAGAAADDGAGGASAADAG